MENSKYKDVSKSVMVSHITGTSSWECRAVRKVRKSRGWGKQSHYKEVPRWEIVMEQELRLGLNFGPVGIAEKKIFGPVFFKFSWAKN